MAFLEWRKFQFFDLRQNIEGSEKLLELSKEINITCTSAGNNYLVFGDSLGQIHLISRSWHINTFRGYEICIEHSFQLRSSPFLITIGHDEPGINPLIKVWDISKFDRNGIPFCQRITKAVAGSYPVQVSCLAVCDNQQLMAVGFLDGSLILYRGDITREKSSKQKTFKDVKTEITGLAFKLTANRIFLFVSTYKEVFVYNITQKDKEQKYQLDNIGCSRKCSVLAESTQESHFMVARNNAIYCYTPDGRGPCYAVDGEKILLEWFRTYLIIISKSNRSSSLPKNIINNVTTPQSTNQVLITVLDIYNKFIVYQYVMPNIRAVLYEWGSFFILGQDYRIYSLEEKDLQSKLSLLFKKNLYDVAIRIAKSQQYHLDGLVDIFKQYGDHLREKGDHAGAIEQYTKTIGKLEPSYVIRKFVDSQHLEKLIIYLQALHKQGQATEDHTTLLLNCYTKLNNTVDHTASLREFILSKESDLNYDVDIAIKVCRQGNLAEALKLAEKHEKHDWYIKIQIEDHQNYVQVLDYISSLKFEEADHYMKKYGQILIEHLPFESIQLLKRLCTNFKPNNSNNASDNIISAHYDIEMKSDPEDFIHLFLNNSSGLVEFLEHLITAGCFLSSSVYNTLLEQYLHVWVGTEASGEKQKIAHRILELLQNPDIKLNKSHALVVCDMHSFSEGILYLYEEQKLYQQILRYHISRNDPHSVLACCTRFGHQDPTLWVQALWSCVRDNKELSIDLLKQILTVIAKEKLFSPQLVIDAVSTGNAEITLGHIRSYIMNELQQEMKKSEEIAQLTGNYKKDTEKLKNHIEQLKNGVTHIQGSRCAACHHHLELPAIHFLCNHSFHQHCFQTCSDDESECPTCQPENKDLIELLKAREYNKDLHETFHFQLDKAHDGFSVAAEYFARGLFNNYRILRDEIIGKTLPLIGIKEIKAERIDRNYNSSLPTHNKPTKVDRIVETKLEPQRNVQVPTRSKHSNLMLKNPFEDDADDEDDVYDEEKNPFRDEDEELDKTNPFRDDYDSDKNFNPFN